MKNRIILVFVLFAILFTSAISYAQSEQNQNTINTKPEDLSFSNARASDAATLISNNNQIKLWGVKNINSPDAVFNLKALTLLENKVLGKKIRCIVKSNIENTYTGQCINSEDEDLSLVMIANGFVSVDRNAVYGTVYEEPYINMEKQAQKQKYGIWNDSNNKALTATTIDNPLVLLIIAISVVFILALSVFTFYMLKGFQEITKIQSESIHLAGKERELRKREKILIFSLIDSEIKENKTKIDAYLIIYEELLADLNKTQATYKYQRTGEIVQKQPALSRVVFDGNTDKLDIIGEKLSSLIIHYYARIKTTPDFIDLNIDMPLDQARKIVRQVIDNAIKLNQLSDMIVEQTQRQLNR